MKLTISILFCVILTLQYNGADGAPENLFGRIHDTVHSAADKVREDVHHLFASSTVQETNDGSSNIHFEEDEPEVDWAGRKPVEVTPAPSPVPSTTTSSVSTTTEKDGRENFSGGCIAGYMRTPDGRCKPTF